MCFIAFLIFTRNYLVKIVKKVPPLNQILLKNHPYSRALAGRCLWPKKAPLPLNLCSHMVTNLEGVAPPGICVNVRLD